MHVGIAGSEGALQHQPATILLCIVKKPCSLPAVHRQLVQLVSYTNEVQLGYVALPAQHYHYYYHHYYGHGFSPKVNGRTARGVHQDCLNHVSPVFLSWDILNREKASYNYANFVFHVI